MKYGKVEITAKEKNFSRSKKWKRYLPEKLTLPVLFDLVKTIPNYIDKCYIHKPESVEENETNMMAGDF